MSCYIRFFLRQPQEQVHTLLDAARKRISGLTLLFLFCTDFSCHFVSFFLCPARFYSDEPIPTPILDQLAEFVHAQTTGPLRSGPIHMELSRTRLGVPWTSSRSCAQRCPSCFFIALCWFCFADDSAYVFGKFPLTAPRQESIVDFAYLAQRAVIKAQLLGLSSCWIGAVRPQANGVPFDPATETVPACVVLGIIDESPRCCACSYCFPISPAGWFGIFAGSESRYPWSTLSSSTTSIRHSLPTLPVSRPLSLGR